MSDLPSGAAGKDSHDTPSLRRQIIWLSAVVAALVVVLMIAGLIMGRPADRAKTSHFTAATAADMQAQMLLEDAQQMFGRSGVSSGGPHTIAKLLTGKIPGVRVVVGPAAAATDTKTMIVGPGSHANRFAFYARSRSGIVWRLDGTPTKLIGLSQVTG